MSVCLHVYLYGVCHARTVQKSAGGRFPGARVTDEWNLPYGGWELVVGLL